MLIQSIWFVRNVLGVLLIVPVFSCLVAKYEVRWEDMQVQGEHLEHCLSAEYLSIFIVIYQSNDGQGRPQPEKGKIMANNISIIVTNT